MTFHPASAKVELDPDEKAYLQNREIIFVGQTQYPPFEFLDENGEYTGMTIELIRWMSTEFGFRARFKHMPFQNAQEAVQSGAADVLTSFFYSEERDKFFDFSYTLFEVPASMFVPTDRYDIRDLNDLNGKVIAIQRGDYAHEFLQDKKIDFRSVDCTDFASATNLVIQGKADVVIGDEQIVLYYLYRNNLRDRIKKVGEPLYIGQDCIAVREGNATLLSILDKGFQRARISGTLDKTIRKWLGSGLVGASTFWVRYQFHILTTVAILIAILLLFWLWNFNLRRKVSKRTLALTESNEQLQREISDRIEIQESLATSQYRLQALGDNLPNGAIFQLVFHKDEYFFRYVSAGVFDLIGIEHEKLLESSQPAFDRICAEDRSRFRAELQHSATELVTIDTIWRSKADGQETRWFRTCAVPRTEKDGSIVWDGYMLDITREKQTEKELLLLASVVDQVAEIIIVTNPDGVISYVNPAFERISGFKRNEVTDRLIETVISNESVKMDFQTILSVVADGTVWQGSITHNTKSDGQYEVECAISPIRHQDGSIVNLVWVQRDVSHERELQKQLRQAQKMEAIGNLAGGIAHDFNNILSAVLGYTELAIYEEKTGKPVQKELIEIQKSGQRARELVQQILTFSRQTETERKPLRIGYIIKEAMRMLRPSLPSTIRINQDVRSSSIVLADPTQIHQIIMNLSTNAYHAMREDGGILEISLIDMEWEEVPHAHRFNLEEGKYLRLSIVDTGHGMPPDIRERIFEPYFTTKPQGEGSGIGLSIVHGIVTSYNGDILVWSEPGKGTRFDIYLPVTKETMEEDQQDKVPERKYHPVRILFVDDEETLVNMAKRVLKLYGHNIVAFTSPSSALDYFRENHDDLDIVVTDMTMPIMTGIQFCRIIKEVNPDMPVILTTGFQTEFARKQIRSAGVSRLILKPFEGRDLAEAIEDLLFPTEENE